MNTHHCLPLHIIIVSTSTDLEDEINCHRNHPSELTLPVCSSYVWSLSLWHWTCHVTHFDQLDKRCKQMAYICALELTLLECCRHVKKSVELCCWPDNQHQMPTSEWGRLACSAAYWLYSYEDCRWDQQQNYPAEPCPSSWLWDHGKWMVVSWGRGEQTFS